MDKNKITQSSTRENNLRDLRRKARIRTIKGEKAIENKKKFIELRLTEKRKSLEDKFRKFEYRVRKDEFMQVKQTWWRSIIILSFATIAFKKARGYHVIYMQIYKQRSSFMFGVIKIIVKVLARFRRTLRDFRTKRSIGMLAPFRKYVRRWVVKRRASFTNTIVDTFEQMEYGSLLFRVIAAWRLNVTFNQVLKIQRTIRRFLSVQRARKLVLLKFWDRESEVLYASFNMNTSSRRRSSVMVPKNSTLHNQVFLSDAFKTKYIVSYISFKFKELILNYFEYDHVCKDIFIKFQKNYRYLRISALNEGKNPDIKPEYPPKPRLNLYKDKAKFHKIIQEAFMRKIAEGRRMSLLTNDRELITSKNALSFL